MNNNKLFSKVSVGTLELNNRMVMAPMTRNRAGEGDIPQDLNVDYYRQRASAGLIITEASPVSAAAVGYPATPGIYNEQQMKGWRKITDAVHAEGGHIFIQLWYCGRISHPDLLPQNRLPVAPSAIRPLGQAFTYEGMKPFVEPRELTVAEINEIVLQYKHAAELARQAGFDGVELHAANGYLIDQFLRDGSNKRNDEYGGSVKNRMRFLNLVIDAVLEVWEASRIGVRLSPENTFNDMSDSDPQAHFQYFVTQLAARNLAYIHFLEGDMAGGSRNLDYRKLRDACKGTYIANNGYDRERAEAAISHGDCDLVAFGIPFLANPDLVYRYQHNLALNEADQSTFYGGDEKGYTDYPFASQSVSG
jgi:N-ethylmaleimide reductase